MPQTPRRPDLFGSTIPEIFRELRAIRSVTNRALASTSSPAVSPFLNVLALGAKGDGTTDDTATINGIISQAATAGGGIVYFPATAGGYYCPGGLQLKSNVFLEGASADFGGFSGQGSAIDVGAAAVDVISLPNDGTVTASGMGLLNLQIRHGTNGLKSLNFASYVRIENCTFVGQSNAGIYIEGGIEQWVLDNVKLNGQTYGWRHVNAFQAGSANTKAYMDKCSFRDVLCTGQVKSGWYIEALTSNEATWINPVLNFCGQHGFYADGAFTSWTFVNTNCETNGQSGKTTVTTGSMTSGSSVVTVASAGDSANGDPVVVAGAGPTGDLITTISSGGGTTSWTLAASASRTVTSVEVTNRGYDDFSFNNTIGTPDQIGFYNGESGHGTHIRYAIRGDRVNTVALINHSAARPAYILDQLTVVGGESSVRQVAQIGGSTMRSTIFGHAHSSSEMPWTMVTSPPGKPFYLCLRDSTDNGSGTFSIFEVLRRDGSVPLLIDSGANIVLDAGQTYINKALNMRDAIYPATPAGTRQTGAALWAGTGAPSNANGSDGHFYFRYDTPGVANQRIYVKSAGSWVGIV